jgi:hypothetical protein
LGKTIHDEKEFSTCLDSKIQEEWLVRLPTYFKVTLASIVDRKLLEGVLQISEK